MVLFFHISLREVQFQKLEVISKDNVIIQSRLTLTQFNISIDATAIMQQYCASDFIMQVTFWSISNLWTVIET